MNSIRKCIFFLFLITPLLLAGCLNEGENKSNSSQDSSKTPPELRITIGEDTFTPVRGTYSWSYDNKDGTSTGVNSDSAPPPELVNKKQVVKVTPDTEVYLQFEEAPEDYKVKIWDPETKEVKSRHDEMVLPKSDGIVIYEIIAKWDQGTVSYGFSLNVGPT